MADCEHSEQCLFKYPSLCEKSQPETGQDPEHLCRMNKQGS